MQREIGSNFWVSPDEITKSDKEIDIRRYGICGSDVVFLSTGRSAEKMVLETVEEHNPMIRKVALVPPFTCETVLAPFIQLGYKLYSYQMDRNLITSPDMLKIAIQKYNPDVVLFHRYFGFDTFGECDIVIQEARNKGVVFIEDRTQSLYSKHKHIDVDFVIGSFRKWLGVPDGSFAVCKEGNFKYKPEEYNEPLQKMKLEASFEKYKYMNTGEGSKEVFLKKYRDAEDILYSAKGHYRMSPSSRELQESLDVEYMNMKRRDNYRFVYERLKGLDGINVLTSELEADIVPLYYTMIVEDRAALQVWLRDNAIYAPIVWTLPDIKVDICEAAEYVYKHVLSLPIDQRYGLDDMSRMVECIQKWR